VRRVNVIVSCTRRKNGLAAPSRQIRTYRLAGTLSRSLQCWIDRLASVPEEERVCARDLYAGDHWQVVRSLPGNVAGTPVHIWVVSAGYGIIPIDATLAAYDATFSRGHEDDIGLLDPDAQRKRVLQEWWDGLADWEGPVKGQPRSLNQLARTRPGEAFVVALSGTYVRVLQRDLGSLISAAGHEAVSVFSAGTTGRLPGRVHYDGRWQRRLGGSLMSLNIRACRLALSTATGATRSALQSALDCNGGRIRQSRQPNRPRLSDRQARTMILRFLKREPQGTWSSALRWLRDEQRMACEQKRFKHLFLDVRSSRGT
jgi:hypothetical protein